MTLNWKPRFKSLRSIWLVMLSKPTWPSGYTVAGATLAILLMREDGYAALKAELRVEGASSVK